MNIIDRISQLLMERDWTVYKLAREAGLTDKSIYKWMIGFSQPTVKALESVCQAFGITLAEFFAEKALIEVSEDLKSLYFDWVSLKKEEQDAVRALIKRNVRK